MKFNTILVLAALATPLAASAPALAKSSKARAYTACATNAQKAAVLKMQGEYPGDPVAIVGRDLKVPEMVAASGFGPEGAVGARITGNEAAQFWQSIDGWGADTKVWVVLSPASEHAFIVHGKVPVTQPNPDPGYLDVYADKGDGIHSHIQLSKVAAVFATDIPTDDPAFRTRGINFYDQKGNNIVGIYASLKKYTPDPIAIAGFERTRELIRTLPRICR